MPWRTSTVPLVDPRSITTIVPSGAGPNWAWVLDTDMSADCSGIRCATCSPLRGSGRRPTSARPAITKLSPLSKCARHRWAGGWCGGGDRLGGHRAAGAAAVGASSGEGCWAGGGGASARGCGVGRRRRPGHGLREGCRRLDRRLGHLGRQLLTAHRLLGPLGGPHRLDRGRRDEAHGGQVDDVARPLVGHVGDRGGRAYVDHDAVGQVVVPAATPATAFLDGRPRQGGERRCRRWAGRTTPEHERAQEGPADTDRGAGAVVHHPQARQCLAGRAPGGAEHDRRRPATARPRCRRPRRSPSTPRRRRTSPSRPRRRRPGSTPAGGPPRRP